MQKLIIEVAQNEDNVSKEDNPNVPFTPEEIAADAIACAKAGASIVHFHNKDPKTGVSRVDDPEIYVETVRLIRKESDVIVCPSYNTRFTDSGPIKEALKYWDAFAEDPMLRPEVMGVVPKPEGDYGTHYNPDIRDFDRRKQYVMGFLEFLKEYDVVPFIWCTEAGHFREVLAYLDVGLIKEPLNIKFYFSDHGLYGVEPTPENYVKLASLMDPAFNWQVITTVYGPPDSKSKNALNPLAISMGHHIRTGVGDLNRSGFGYKRPMQGAEKTVSNPDLVRQLVAYAESVGRGVATPAEAREILGVKPFGSPPNMQRT